VQVKTEVTLSSTRPSSAPATDTVGRCVAAAPLREVVTSRARRSRAPACSSRRPRSRSAPSKRGRFCVACPAGERTFLVDAPGFTPVTRGVELNRSDIRDSHHAQPGALSRRAGSSGPRFGAINPSGPNPVFASRWTLIIGAIPWSPWTTPSFDDFLVDSHEGLDRLDRDLLALERDPARERADL
jgi:hypothetical protein